MTLYMKTVILSDLHFSGKFDEKKYNFLVNIIKPADKVILNGDLWDSWFVDFNGFVTSEWKRLFPLLLSKNTVYLNGNHDPKYKCDERVNLFCVENSDKYVEESNGVKFYIEHGDKLVEGKQKPIIKVYGFIIHLVGRTPIRNFMHHFIHFVETVGFKLIGPHFESRSRLGLEDNLLIKKLKSPNEWLVNGHTHFNELDHEVKYANSGFIIKGYATYLIIENGEIRLIEGSY